MLPTCCLGVYLDSLFDWKEHVAKLLSSCYVALVVLRKMHHLAAFKVKKLLVERLILS